MTKQFWKMRCTQEGRAGGGSALPGAQRRAQENAPKNGMRGTALLILSLGLSRACICSSFACM